ncbi:MAG TPA: hypothetical protein VM073_11870 [Usitatibacter sp.]|nr:hypothetical protein [Usitatibacter sp.]
MAREGGGGLLLVAVFLLAVMASVAAIAMSAQATSAHRQRITERALAQAREALIAHAAERPITREVGPGHLPCPDTDDDGWAEATCGSLSGHLGQADRLGRLPWKTLGLPDLRDGYGERLWYAVSTRYKGLLNCAASPECRALNPATGVGTITVRDVRGGLMHDGTLADAARAADGGAAAVVFAPGPALTRYDGRIQTRDCAAGDCDPSGRCMTDPPQRAARCDPANFLDVAPAQAGGEDNARFHDRSDARAGNADGFIQGPVAAPGGALAVNDRLAVIGYADVMPRIMARVALELAHCLGQDGAVSALLPACDAGPSVGRIQLSEPAGASCNARAIQPAWWPAWSEHVLHAAAAPGGLEVVDAAGRRTAAGRRLAVIATRFPGDCPGPRLACATGGCTRIVATTRTRERHDAVVTLP